MVDNYEVVSPIDSKVYKTGNYHNYAEISELITKAQNAQKDWAELNLDYRIEKIKSLPKHIESLKEKYKAMMILKKEKEK